MVDVVLLPVAVALVALFLICVSLSLLGCDVVSKSALDHTNKKCRIDEWFNPSFVPLSVGCF